MIYKGRVPLFENQKSNMRRVLALIRSGINDRQTIAETLGLTNKQVRYAIWNLQTAGLIEPLVHHFKGVGQGRGDTIYKPAGEIVPQSSPYAGVSFIFTACESRDPLERELKNINFDTMPDSGYIRLENLVPHIIPIAKSTLWRMCKDGRFPKPVKLSTKITAWLAGDVRAWLREKDGKG